MTKTTLLVVSKDEGPEESFWIDGNSQHLDSVAVIKVRTGYICYITKHLRAGHYTTCKLCFRKRQCCENEVQQLQRHMSASSLLPQPLSFLLLLEVVVDFRPARPAHRPRDSVIFLWAVEHSAQASGGWQKLKGMLPTLQPCLLNFYSMFAPQQVQSVP